MKSYTDLEQSKKLKEILPYDTADGTWKRVAIAGINLDVPEGLQYFHDGDTPFVFYSGIGLPSWSLTALLKLIPYNVTFNKAVYRFKLVKFSDHWECYHENFGAVSIDVFKADNPVDACYEMILKLHEQKLL